MNYYNLFHNPVDTGKTHKQEQFDKTTKDVPVLKCGELEGIWTNDTLPTIGDRVRITFNQFGKGEIVGFFIEAGYLGGYVKVDSRPEWHIRQYDGAPRNPMVFGAEIEFCNKGTDLTCNEWRKWLELSTKERFGLQLNDVGEEDDFKNAWADGDTPNDYLDRVKEKHDLTEIKEVM